MGKNCKLKKYNSLQIIADVIGLQYDKIYYPRPEDRYHIIYQQAKKYISKSKYFTRELLVTNSKRLRFRVGRYNTIRKMPINTIWFYIVDTEYSENLKQIKSKKTSLSYVTIDGDGKIIQHGIATSYFEYILKSNGLKNWDEIINLLNERNKGEKYETHSI